MLDDGRRAELLRHIRPLLPYARGILVYGSWIKGYSDSQSDIDTCVIPKVGIDLGDLYREILRLSEDQRYDIIIYSDAPWYLKGEILENSLVVYALDADELDFWMYKQRKIWHDMSVRQSQATIEDLLKRAKGLRGS